jgi:inositol phosphorylceramide synthase catalytic subunit
VHGEMREDLRVGRRVPLAYPLVLGIFLIIMAWHGLLRVEHALVAALIVACFATPASKRFAVLLMPMALIGIFYDVQKVVTLEIPVHVTGPYILEKVLFGIPTADGRITLNELFLRWHGDVLDVLTAFPYLTYIFEAVALFLYFFIRDKERCWRFGWVFFVVNIAGLLTNILFPVAPPWYVTEHGFGPAVRGAVGHPAAALRFDALTGTHVFAALYARESDAFGAMPSLHVAYPIIVALALYTARKDDSKWLKRLAWAYCVLMAFAAVYLQHHYVIDVVAGLAYGLAGHFVVGWVLDRRPSAVPASVDGKIDGKIGHVAIESRIDLRKE